jgi:hypothetical protein
MRRINVEQAVVPRYRCVLRIVGQADLTILGPTDQAEGSLVEVVGLAAKAPPDDLDDDLGGHGVTSLRPQGVSSGADWMIWFYATAGVAEHKSISVGDFFAAGLA